MAAACLILAALAGLIAAPRGHAGKLSDSATAAQETAITISAVGDCVLGSDDRFRPALSFNHYRRDLGKPDDYFFSGVREVLAKDDLTIANAECVIAGYDRRVEKPSQHGGEFWFRGDAQNARIFAAGSVEAVNLANNHSFDYGEEGLKETISNLERAGVAPFGCGVSQILIRKGVRIGLLGYCVMGPLEQGVDEGALDAQIASDLASMRAKADLIIVTFHWGVEKDYQPTEQQQRLGRFAVDHGADLVLGHHPHVLQPVEVYKGVSIVYSLGDFVYGGSSRVGDRATMIFQQTFDFTGAGFRLTGRSSHQIPCFVHEDGWNDYRPILASRPSGSPNVVEPTPSDFVRLDTYVPSVVLDLRYATDANAYHHRFYQRPLCYLRRPAADRLRVAAAAAAREGLRLKVWDAYRPASTQRRLQRYVSDPRWIAQGVSNHTRGVALDVTLIDAAGKELDMGTGFDEFSPRACWNAEDLTPLQSANRWRLLAIMTGAGFHALATEWWHFDAPESRRYPAVDVSI
ncbi:hypothetical protein CCAX7_18230 [Capsulimonas corticalis]|uniref:D-alanyl-D-alanine dipeptidase n=1 Tax=Capsulimonas corticalis TaxID=2219043 RepID=A0A9N7L166_9BACT|nr:hypothetical protein CCAX7_18230 [Capsulimonas corticalis]